MIRLARVAAPLILAVGLATATAASATPALASARAAHHPAATGAFSTWPAAQRAAGFRLRRPTRSYGLPRTGRIHVLKCEVTGETAKRNVVATYQTKRHQRVYQQLALSQNNWGHPCGNIGEAKVLGHYRIQGARATLWGECGFHGAPSCRSHKIFLALIWTRHRVAFVATSFNERRGTLLGFARSLRPVR